VINNTTSIANNLNNLRRQISAHELTYHRQPGSVSLLAVSKRKPVADIRQAIAAGQRAFGENYVDEAVTKILEIADDTLEWHYIGAIQSRKTAQIAKHFSWAHGVDRLKIANRLSEHRPDHLPPLNVCLQLNLDNEASKAGIGLQQLPELAAACSELSGIRLRGLMAIPAPRTEFDTQRELFAQVREALATLTQTIPQLDTLSMGMSADLQAAIAEGASIVRIGTAIFGLRES